MAEQWQQLPLFPELEPLPPWQQLPLFPEIVVPSEHQHESGDIASKRRTGE
jgi:hypothetical protein